MKATRAILANGESIVTEHGPGRCWDSEEVSTFEVEVEPGAFRCSLCGEPITGNDPMPPFPQEADFGSEAAVAQAAETLRGFSPEPWAIVESTPSLIKAGGRIIAQALDPIPHQGIDRMWANARLMAAAPDLLRERDALREENERLKSELEHQSALWQTALGHAAEQQAEVERLRAENETVENAVRTRIAGLERQRDALADALEAFIPAGCTCSDNDCLTARAALRLAGRLPEGEGS